MPEPRITVWQVIVMAMLVTIALYLGRWYERVLIRHMPMSEIVEYLN